MLKDVFEVLLNKYTTDAIFIEELWEEIEHCYTNKRHYHSLVHLEKLLESLLPIKNLINDWDTVMFTLFYHDIVYNTLRSDNEDKSAVFAENRMLKIGLPTDMIIGCKKQISATKLHELSLDSDINYFNDADLAILGQEWEVYQQYMLSIRKEYAVFPNLVYNPGRKKVLDSFLKTDAIYKTDYFFKKYNTQAFSNIKKELSML